MGGGDRAPAAGLLRAYGPGADTWPPDGRDLEIVRSHGLAVFMILQKNKNPIGFHSLLRYELD